MAKAKKKPASNRVPIKILEKRIVKLNNLLKHRGGKHYTGVAGK